MLGNTCIAIGLVMLQQSHGRKCHDYILTVVGILIVLLELTLEYGGNS